ncbi:MAG: MarR family winged helix-turn-helix transcriptional regulator [Myxococcota bacterium]
MSDPDAQLAALASASTGQLLLRAARLLDERALARLAEIPGAPPVRPAHTRLFPHLDFSGVRASVLAERLGVTKQAIHPLVTELVEWGLVEQVVDPADRRARLLRFRPDGLSAIAQGLAMLESVEREVERAVGTERMAVFREVLGAWIAALEPPP